MHIAVLKYALLCRNIMLRNRCKNYKSGFILLAVILTASACSSNSSNPAPDNSDQQASPDLRPMPDGTSMSTIDMKTRLATSLSAESVELWACISDAGDAMAYLFFDEGTITGFNNTSVGLEIFHDPDNPTTSLDSQTKYLWTQQSVDSILMESPNSGTSVSLNNIRFTDGDQMSAFSSVRGQLYCSRQSGLR